MTSPTPRAGTRAAPGSADQRLLPGGGAGWQVLAVVLLTCAGLAAITVVAAAAAPWDRPLAVAGIGSVALLAGAAGAVLLDRRAVGGPRAGLPAALTAGLFAAAALTIHLAPVRWVSEGVGQLQTAVAAAAAAVGVGALATLPLPRGRLDPRPAVGDLLVGRWRVTGVELALLVVLCGGVLAAALPLAALPFPLGHDESVYAVQARTWLSGSDSGGVIGLHRAPLLPLIGIPAVVAGGAEWSLRLAGVLFGLVAVVGVWRLGRSIGSPAAGLLAAATFVFARPVLDASGLYLTDLPAAALLLVATAVLWHELEIRDAPGPWLVSVAPLAAGAFYLRYGSALVIALLGATALAVWWRRVLANPRWAVAAAGLFVLLLVPHAVNATVELGAPWARVTYTSEVAGRDYLGQGLVEYLRWWPRELAGALGGAIAGLGVAAGALTVVAGIDRRRLGRRGRGYLFLVAPAVGHIALIGIAAHGDTRFVFYALAVLLVAGTMAIVEAVREVASRVGLAAAGVTLGAVGVVVAASAAGSAVSAVAERAAGVDNVAVLVAASDEIERRSPGSCAVLTSYGPQVSWYSGCSSESFGSPPQPGRDDLLEGDIRFLLLFEGGKRQPEGEVLEAYLRETEPLAAWSQPGAALPRAELYRF